MVRRINLLTALALLLSGLLQPLAATQGGRCARTQALAPEAGLAIAPALEISAALHDAPRAISAPHQHDSVPQPNTTGALSGSCGVAAIISEQRVDSPAAAARQRLHESELPPTSLLIRSLFRPPRLS